jgi:SOS-response transcriptional repressor LexA
MQEKRPSKKQYELLKFIEEFIKTVGYGPSYREIMRALNYKSVSTVAVHVDGLIKNGLLRKIDNSARSLEVVVEKTVTAQPESAHITWLKSEIKKREVHESMAEVEILSRALDLLAPKKPTE